MSGFNFVRHTSAAVFLLTASAASAALNITFDAGSSPYTLIGDGQIVQGTLLNEHAAPFGDTTSYLSTFGSTDLLISDPIAISVSLLHGSVDNYNALDLLNVAGEVFQHIDYIGNGDQGPAGTQSETYYFRDGELAGLRFSSSSKAFEVDDITTYDAVVTDSVPEPGEWELLLSGFGLVGVAARRRTTAKALSISETAIALKRSRTAHTASRTSTDSGADLRRQMPLR